VTVLENTAKDTLNSFRSQRENIALHFVHRLLDVRTAVTVLDNHIEEKRRADVNEFFLFMGTNKEVVKAINISDSLPLSSGIYGSGLYFSDSSTQADAKAVDDHDGLYRGLYAMLLCRVVLGNTLKVSKEDIKSGKADKDLDGLSVHSILAGEESESSSRQFILRNASQTHLSYIIIYRRASKLSHLNNAATHTAESKTSLSNDLGGKDHSDHNEMAT